MIEGACRCGACRIALAREALPLAYACHCHQCQRWSGSAFSLNCIVREASVSVTGPVVAFERVTEDRTSTQRVCGACHTRLYNTNTRRPGVAVIRAGTLDRSEELACVAHIFTRTKQGWVTLPAEVPHWPDAPPPQALRRLLG